MPHDPDDSWSESVAYEVHICKDWRIVTPAPSEAKPENVLAFDPGSGRTAGRRAGDSKPAKDDPMTAFERIERRVADLESMVHGATTPPPDREPNSPIERALSRCEELRGRMENAVGWLVEHGQRLSALEKGTKPEGKPSEPSEEKTSDGALEQIQGALDSESEVVEPITRV